jgi:hypothetical protein
MAQVGHLNELTEKYYDKGLRIVAISAEPIAKLESEMIGNRDVKYWLGSDPSRATSGRFSTPGSKGIPHAYLVDAAGKVVSDGIPNDQQLEELLAEAFDPALGKQLDKKLASAVKAYGKGTIGKAWTAAGKLAASEERGIAADAKFLTDKAEAYSAFVKSLVEAGIESKDYGIVYDDLATLTDDFAGMPDAAWAATKKAELDKDPAVKNELSAAKALGKAQAKEADAGGKAKKLKGAISAYTKLVKKYAGTKAAEQAEAALKRLVK